MTCRFDESLSVLAEVILRQLGAEALRLGVVLRDVSGRLAFFCDAELDPEVIDRVSSELKAALGPYARTDRVLAGKNEFGAQSILNEPHSLTVVLKNSTVRLIDRRLVGADWLRFPADRSPPPPRFVFASLKGGVGRSTALAVTAGHLASKGQKVLVVDLDMEAPGLGSMLLDDLTVPRFGIIDALVENSLSGLDTTFMADLVSSSSLAHRDGRIDVIPAFGMESINHPGEVLSKIARAYAEDTGEDGSNKTILDQVREIIDSVLAINRYDVVLVDARAGLHETTPAAILGLGGQEVYLFGLNEPQTFQGYRALFAHLFRLCGEARNGDDFISRITMIHAKARGNDDAHKDFNEQCDKLFDSARYTSQNQPTEHAPEPPAEPFNDVPWDDRSDDVSDQELGIGADFGSRKAIAILDDDRFKLFNPKSQKDLLTAKIYDASYGDFLKRIDIAIQASAGETKNAP